MLPMVAILGNMENDTNIIFQKRTVRYTVRFSPDENESLIRKSEDCGLEPSVFIRQSVCKREIKARLTDEEKILYRQLIGMSLNINQLVKAAHINGMFSLLSAIVSTLNELNTLINKFKK